MRPRLFLSLLLALFPLFLLAQVPVTRNSTKPKAKPKTEQAAKPNAGHRPSAASTSTSTAKLNLKNLTSNMVYVSGGTFTMGATSEQGSDADSDEKPTHSVTVGGFYICKYEVTQALWKAVMGSNPSNWKGDNLPVESVSWNDCQDFIRKLNALTGKNFRLPTEAEWEFAARGGNISHGYMYAGSNKIGDVAWYDDNSGDKTHVVGTKSPNELGLYDMSGNVYEWCQDWYGNFSSTSQTNPAGADSGSYRVLRGSSWNDNASFCRSSFRGNDEPDCRADNVGLRLVLDAERTSVTSSTTVTTTTSNAKLNLKNLTSNMVYVSGGTFTMGATSEQGSDAYDDEKPTHSVSLSDFYICKYEVTQDLWEEVMGSNPSNWKGDNLPVESVSWDDCQTFIRKLNALTGKNFRLPTEAEWEFAARGGNNSRGYKYAGSNNIGDVAWYDGNSGSKTHVVGAKSPNELGIYDMSGNVYEWCQDWKGSYSSAPQMNPTGAGNGWYRVLRGGSWFNGAKDCRSSYRDYDAPGDRNFHCGLRLVLSQL